MKMLLIKNNYSLFNTMLKQLVFLSISLFFIFYVKCCQGVPGSHAYTLQMLSQAFSVPGTLSLVIFQFPLYVWQDSIQRGSHILVTPSFWSH